MSFNKILFRVSNWVANIAVASNNIGFLSALTLFIGTRHSLKLHKIRLKHSGIVWNYRGCNDWYVMHQFWMQNYQVIDLDDQIEWIIDAGANIGDSAYRFARFHPNAKIIALEPEAGNAEILTKNLGNFKNVSLEAVGLYSKCTELFLSSATTSVSHSLSESDDISGVAIPVVDIPY